MADNPYAKYAPDASNPYAKYGAASASAKPTVEPPPFLEGVGTGIMDKVYGAAQLGGHIAAVPEQASAPNFGMVPEETQQSVDQTVQKREITLEAEGYNKGWGRTVGNVLGDVIQTAPLSFIPGAAPLTWMGRVGQGMKLGGTGGVISGATQPASSPNFAKEKLEQIGLSGGAGAVGGGLFGVLGAAFAKDSPEAIDAAMKNTFRRNIKPTVSGKETFSQVAKEQQQAVDAIGAIVENKANLEFTDEAGNIIRGETPKTLDQFAQAIEQTKRPIYRAYDDLAKAGEFNQHAAAEAATKREVERRSTELTAAVARQSQGSNVYQWGSGNRAVAEAQDNLQKAQQVAQAATEKANSTREILQRVQSSGGGQVYVSGKISTEPAINAMMSVANSKSIQTVPAIREAIVKTAENLRAVGKFSATELQDYIQFLNSELKSFYGKANIPPGVAQSKALLAAKLRETLDETIEGVAGPGYQALKNKYGALKAIESSVLKRAQVAGREPIGGGIIDRLTNIASVEEMARALMTFDPTAMASAASLKGAQMITRHLKSPNRAVTRLFDAAQRPPAGPPSAPMQFMWGGTPPVLGGAVGGVATDVMGLQ